MLSRLTQGLQRRNWVEDAPFVSAVLLRTRHGVFLQQCRTSSQKALDQSKAYAKNGDENI